MTWYRAVTQDLSQLPNFIDYYEKELDSARYECSTRGNLEKNLAALPGLTEHRFGQLQEIEAVLNYLNIQLRKIRRTHFQKYLEAYNRALTSRDAEKYADGEQEVIDFECLINEVALVRNRYLSVIKAFESKNFMLGHIVRLRTAGMEDISLN